MRTQEVRWLQMQTKLMEKQQSLILRHSEINNERKPTLGFK